MTGGRLCASRSGLYAICRRRLCASRSGALRHMSQAALRLAKAELLRLAKANSPSYYCNSFGEISQSKYTENHGREQP